MTDHLLELSSVTKIFASGDSDLCVLQDIDLVLDQGSSVAITGKSGSGKSTLLHLAGALDRPSRGKVLFADKELQRMNDRQISEFRNRHIGFVFQAHVLLDDFSAWENVCIPALIRGDRYAQAMQRSKQLLDRVGLSERMNHRPQKLSGGERQRVAICRALVNEPDIIIADEPTGSLDEQSSAEIEQLLFDMVTEQHRTLLLVTHDIQLARRCETVYLLQNRSLQELS
jgi:lipoprotein-releasing system ATP-binding protein